MSFDVCAHRRAQERCWRLRRYRAFFNGGKGDRHDIVCSPRMAGARVRSTAVPASAQTWVYESDVPRPRVYEPRAYYEPRPYESPVYESGAYEPVVTAAPPALTPTQRTTIYRTII